jgi:type II secretory pathway component HofQ
MAPAVVLLLSCFALQSGADPKPSPADASAQQQTVPGASCKQVSVSMIEGIERVSISAHEADLRQLLLCLAKIGKISIVLDSRVAGKVTAEFSDVTWHQAMCAILRAHGLAAEVDGLPPCPREVPPMSQVQKEGSEVDDGND